MEERKIQIIAVDFDGTLCTDSYPQIGIPNLPLIDLLRRMREQGKQVILWTCRCGELLEQAVDWCKRFGLEFDAVNENVPETMARYGTESRKISADVYIDDKSCFPWGYGKSWNKVLW
jgi:trehalose-6-phosphatase